MKTTESHIQQQFFRIIRQWYPNCQAFHIPNGGARNIATARRLKSEGVLAGVWDVFVPYPRGGFAGLWIEFKSPGGKLTKHQQEFQAEVGPAYAWMIFEDAITAAKYVAAWMN